MSHCYTISLSIQRRVDWKSGNNEKNDSDGRKTAKYLLKGSERHGKASGAMFCKCDDAEMHLVPCAEGG